MFTLVVSLQPMPTMVDKYKVERGEGGGGRLSYVCHEVNIFLVDCSARYLISVHKTTKPTLYITLTINILSSLGLPSGATMGDKYT